LAEKIIFCRKNYFLPKKSFLPKISFFAEKSFLGEKIFFGGIFFFLAAKNIIKCYDSVKVGIKRGLTDQVSMLVEDRIFATNQTARG